MSQNHSTAGDTLGALILWKDPSAEVALPNYYLYQPKG